MSNEEPTPPPVKPPTQMVQPPSSAGGSKLIPTNNPSSLLSYYLGLFSIFPFLGLIMGVIALVSGRKALIAVKSTPGLPGSTHAKVGIGCGIIGLLFNLMIVLILVLAIINSVREKS